MIGRKKQERAREGYVSLAIIVVLIIGAIIFFLFHRRQTAQQEGREFARQIIEHCVFQHDVKYLHSVVAADRRLAIPPGKDDDFIETLARLGVPNRDYAVTGELQFENRFFSPQGTYKSILRFPDRAGTFYVNVAMTSGIWVVKDYGIIWEKPPD